VSHSWSTSGTRRVTLATNPVICHDKWNIALVICDIDIPLLLFKSKEACFESSYDRSVSLNIHDATVQFDICDDKYNKW
jgi:hypothetical protein